MQLFVRSRDGWLRVVDVDRNASIKAVASLAHGASDRYLTYGGVPLQAERTLQDYGIHHHATLESRPRMRGGCFIFSITLWIIIFLCFIFCLCTCGLSIPVALALIPIAMLLPLCCL